ncbi:hypothetical protein KGF54_002463 [Candida jiufengensis]|uniref:uncharacterized protein n=1 Tax=Candida jiufengensis TaxID=497108 RepID=UPI0022257A4D|nr:uncharacterized protein KGF54_002463 [Candida jiufengensis]KAI5954687.1 hypothetical protein KGF54_002463 [Candida jiufengensis]
MLKRFSRHSNNNHNYNNGKDQLYPIFTESYWQWYIESYLKVDKETVIKHTPYNINKYTDKSQEVIKIKNYFEFLQLNIPCTLEIIAILKSPLTGGDLNKSFYILRIFQLCSEGLFLTNLRIDKLGNKLKFVGAENWDNVMCYMDALFFAMFANLESFEPILFIPNHHDKLINQLSALLRIYVSLLRSGYLITTDLTARICEGLFKLGFNEAISHKQQDSASLFEFLTEVLNMPLLTFKVDIKHGGKFNKKDDEKFSKERILFVSIPNDEVESEIIPKFTETEHLENLENSIPSLKSQKSENEDSILLEECLEHYFNNSISVKRELERRASLSSVPKVTSNFDEIPENSQINNNNNNFNNKKDYFDDHKHSIELVEDINERPPLNRDRSDSRKSNGVRIGVRTRSSTLSIWSLNEDGKSNTSKVKEVNLPAWMFLRLLPFYTDDNVATDDLESAAKSSKEFANRRPILPICLKRYEFVSGDSAGTRSQKRIIIPPFIDLPDFVADDIDEPACSFRLILESAVCHRGKSIESGHFISVVRKNVEKINQTEEEANNSIWYFYDDMKKNHRVIEKSFSEIFNTEWPYMLFYRLVSTNESSTTSSLKSNIVPPNGFKAQYWSDEAVNVVANPPKVLSPILSAEDSIPTPTITTTSPKLTTTSPTPTPTPEKKTSLAVVTSLPPTDPKYVDIKNRYYWYITDADKNYYKEEPTILKDGNSSMTLSPQFRRNSQWSNFSNISNICLDKKPSQQLNEQRLSSETTTSQEATIKPTTEIKANNESSGESTLNSSVWRKSIKRSPNVNLDSSESLGELRKLVSPMDLDDSKNAFPHTVRNLQIEQKKHNSINNHSHHLFHRSKNKREAYKKEKCIIT